MARHIAGHKKGPPVGGTRGPQEEGRMISKFRAGIPVRVKEYGSLISTAG